jgi:hypothetical protein
MNVFILFLSFVLAANPVPQAKKLEINGSLAKIADTNVIVDLKSISSVVHEIPLIDPGLARTQAESEWISLSNLEAKWITGKRYVYVQGQKVEITLAQEVEILRHQARAKAGLPYTPMAQDEKDYLVLQLQNIQDAVDKKLLSDRYKDRFKAELVSTTHEASRAVAKATSTNNGNIFILVLDGIPYFLGNLPSGNIMEYVNKQVNLKSDLGLACNLPTTPPSHPNVKLKLDTYYATLSHFSYGISNQMFIGDTIENTAFCNVSGGDGNDRIFAGGFEAGL